MNPIKNAIIRTAVFIIVALGSAVSNIYNLLFPDRSRMSPRIDEKRKYNVLVIKLWAIGEVCMTTPVIRELRRNFPSISLSILVGKNSADLFKNNPHIDEVIGVDENIFLNFNLPALTELINRLKSQGFNIAIVLHHSVLFNIFAWLIGAKIRVGFDRNGEGFLNTIKIKPLSKSHKANEYLSVIEAMGGGVSDRRPEIFPTNQDEEYVEYFLEKNGISKNDLLIGIMPTGGANLASERMGARLDRKAWPLEHYIKLCRMLIEELGAKVLILGGKAEVEKANRIKSSIKGPIIDAADKMNLRQLNSLARRCALIVTNDSGPMHIVSAGSPTLLFAIFGPTDPSICGPISKNSYIIDKNLSCSPCFKGDVFPNVAAKCDKEISCMESVSPEEVFGLIRRNLQAKASIK